MYPFPVGKQKSGFECGYYVIMFTAIMYRKVVSGNFTGAGRISGRRITPDDRAIKNILLKCDARDKCLLIMKDLLLLFSALDNISVQINIREA
jgi:hypothetical protein